MTLSRNAPEVSGLPDGDEAAGLVALDRQNRMHDETDIDPAVGKLRQHRVDQERHVVVDDLEHQLVAPTLADFPRPDGVEADVGHARLAHREQGPCVGSELGELPGIVTQQILGDCMRKDLGDEIRWDFAMAVTQELPGRGDQRRFGTLFIAAGKIGGCHGVLPRRAAHVRPWRSCGSSP